MLFVHGLSLSLNQFINGHSLVICGPHSNTVENVEGPACGIDHPVSNILRNGAFLENGALWVSQCN